MVAVQYTGSNSAEILAAAQAVTQYSGNAWAVQSELGGVLTLVETPAVGAVGVWPIASGQWVIIAMDFGIIARLSSAAYQARYRLINDIVNAALLQVGSIGIALVPELTASGTTTVTVQIRPAQPDTSYTASASLAGGTSLLGSLSIVAGSVTKVSGSVVTAQVRNSGLVTLSGALLLVNTTASASLR